MEYFFYCRDAPEGAEIRRAIVEEHWAFMDRYADAMIARGPTLSDDGASMTGSMHMVDLPDAAAAQVFGHDEPFAKAGAYAEIIVRPCTNAMKRTMWEFEGDPDTNQRFLIIGHGKPGMSDIRDGLLEAHRRYFIDRGYQEKFIARGPLWSDDGEDWVGSEFIIELPDRAAVDAFLADEPYTNAGLYEQVEIHRWRFGGRQ
ncbi:MAG: hypothetical protein GKS02_08640 [Alphaproteobacteria bacterium]|nr:hypothetical protein [Alphaproteobacteria bacterium]